MPANEMHSQALCNVITQGASVTIVPAPKMTFTVPTIDSVPPASAAFVMPSISAAPPVAISEVTAGPLLSGLDYGSSSSDDDEL